MFDLLLFKWSWKALFDILNKSKICQKFLQIDYRLHKSLLPHKEEFFIRRYNAQPNVSVEQPSWRHLSSKPSKGRGTSDFEINEDFTYWTDRMMNICSTSFRILCSRMCFCFSFEFRIDSTWSSTSDWLHDSKKTNRYLFNNKQNV